MTSRRTISICIAAIVFLLARSMPAYQAEEATKDAAKTAKKKPKKAAQPAEATGTTAAAASAEKADKTPRKARKAASAQPPETGAPFAAPGAPKATPSAIGTASRDASSAGATATQAPTGQATVVSKSEMEAAQASGQVWVNTDTGVYHKSGRWYGATKHGKFMTEQEATKAGYRASKGKP